MKELQKFQSSTFDTLTRQKFIEDQNTIMELFGRLQELQNEVNCMSDSKDFQDAESVRSGNSHVTSQPGLFPKHPPFEGMLRPSFVSPRRTDGPPNIWDTSGMPGNVFANPQASSSAPYPQELNSLWKKTIEEPLHMSTAEKSDRPERDLVSKRERLRRENMSPTTHIKKRNDSKKTDMRVPSTSRQNVLAPCFSDPSFPRCLTRGSLAVTCICPFLFLRGQTAFRLALDWPPFTSPLTSVMASMSQMSIPLHILSAGWRSDLRQPVGVQHFNSSAFRCFRFHTCGHPHVRARLRCLRWPSLSVLCL